MASNLGKITRYSNLVKLQRPDPTPGPSQSPSAVGPRRSTSASDEGSSKARANEVSLDPELLKHVDPERPLRFVGYAALGVTFVVFGVLLWPWLAERFA